MSASDGLIECVNVGSDGVDETFTVDDQARIAPAFQHADVAIEIHDNILTLRAYLEAHRQKSAGIKRLPEESKGDNQQQHKGLKQQNLQNQPQAKGPNANLASN